MIPVFGVPAVSERVYKVHSIFIQNGEFGVTVGKFDAKTLERDWGDVTVGTKNSQKRTSKTGLSQPRPWSQP